MRGWVYLIKNGDLYKIGVTRNFESRMRQLKPDKIISKFYTNKFLEIEKELHKRYKEERIPQTEYFRLNNLQVRDYMKKVNSLLFTKIVILTILFKSFLLLFLIFVFLIFFESLFSNDIEAILFNATLLTYKITLLQAFISIIKGSGNILTLDSDIKIRFLKFFIYIIFAFFIKLSLRLI